MRYQKIELATDGGPGARARLGLLVLRTDQTVELEARQIMGAVDGVTVHHARLWNDFAINRETLMAMKPLIPVAAKLLPVEWGLKAIGYGCTSATMVIGEQEVERLVRSVHPQTAVTNPVTGATAALTRLGVERLALVTPYLESVNETIAAGFRANGFEIPAFVSFEEPDDNIVGKITGEALLAAARRAVSDGGVDGVFVSCTSLRLVDSVARIEDAIGLPVTSSNHAMLWHMLRLAGIDDRLTGFGRLFELGLDREQERPAATALRRSA